MFDYRVIQGICELKPISNGAKNLLQWLYSHVIGVRYSNSQIGKKLGISSRQVQNLLKELKDFNLIYYTYHEKRNYSGKGYNSRIIWVNTSVIPLSILD